MSIDITRAYRAVGSAAYDVSFPLFGFALLYGGAMYVQSRKRALGLFLGVVIISYVGFFAIATVHSQGQYGQYLDHVQFVFAIIRALCVDDIANNTEGVWRKRLVVLSVSVALVSGNVLLFSDTICDGDRYDYKAATRFVEQNSVTGDVVFCRGIRFTERGKCGVYTEEVRALPLRLHHRRVSEVTRIDMLAYFEGNPNRNQVWIVLPDEVVGPPSSENDWFYESAMKVASFGSHRANHHNRVVGVYTLSRRRFMAISGIDSGMGVDTKVILVR